MLLIIFSTTAALSDIFSSSIWNFLSGIGAIIALPIALAGIVLGYRQQRRRKEITYQLVSDAPIANIHKIVENRVRVFIENTEVKAARLLVLKLWNSGRGAIEAEDYFEPLIFEFNNAEVLNYDLLKTEPHDLIRPEHIKTFLKPTNNSVEFPTFPLNPKNSITLTVLTSGESSINMQGRIKEGKIIRYYKRQRIGLITWI